MAWLFIDLVLMVRPRKPLQSPNGTLLSSPWANVGKAKWLHTMSLLQQLHSTSLLDQYPAHNLSLVSGCGSGL